MDVGSNAEVPAQLWQELSVEDLRRMTLAQIETVASTCADPNAGLWGLMERDERVGVRRLAVRQLNRLRRHNQELARQGAMLDWERRLWGRGAELVAGVDEVGRGCLAGPVVAAAVILPKEICLNGLDDSKKLSPARREALAVAVRSQALAVSVAAVEAEEIDRINILQGSLKAMRLALEELALAPHHVLVDGNQAPNSGLSETTLVDGDARSLSIAAASAVAKVFRDRLMVEADKTYPDYGFARHKGYGSAEHVEALERCGPCPLHRRTFGPVARLVGQNQAAAAAVFAEELDRAQTWSELEGVGARIKSATDHFNPKQLEQLRRLFRQNRYRLTHLGHRGEAAAAQWYLERGYTVLASRYRGGGGEVDLVVGQGDIVVFVEVKTAGPNALGFPEDRIDRVKIKRIVGAARHYLAHEPESSREFRFDVMGVLLGENKTELKHIEAAFTG